VCKFSRGSRGFDPSFSKTEKIRMVTVDKIRDSSRMERLKNRTDVESTESEICWARVRFSVTGKKK